jgi:hypothetical protein
MELSALILTMTLNWMLAHAMPSLFFAFSSFALFGWGLVFVAKNEPVGAALLSPILITRASVLVSLIFIESGGFIKELARIGQAGEASASYVFYTIVMMLAYSFVVSSLKNRALVGLRSDIIDRINFISRYPQAIAIIIAAFVFLYFGITTGFPTLTGIDRFAFRAQNTNLFVGGMIIYKFLPTILLGVIAFSDKTDRILKGIAFFGLAGLVVLYFLFGEKFFSILELVAFFCTPYMIKKSDVLLETAARMWPVAVGSFVLVVCMTLFIYSDYGSGNVGVGLQRLQDRMTEQAEVWYIETQDEPQVFGVDMALLKRNIEYLGADDPDTYLDKNGLATQYFSLRFQTKADLALREHLGGTITLTMAYEAMAVAIFGYVGAIGFMAATGVLFALFAVYLYRALLSEFAPSIVLATWGYLQMMSMSQQATFHQVLGVHSMTHWAEFLVFEAALFALNTSRRPKSPGAKGTGGVKTTRSASRGSGKARAAQA